ncbi:translocation/assembly module TamB domain-containing protein [Liberibacter crescens]|uniref:translocation/assembly module TamB domain-containing protein n=1 Tax=Liberibacter crescens TaxID=1273132 RepID=UPI000763118F|nr:translocation/assembly module TamB domain-containing protein [Liberibacter crescens]AMC13117.1 hypothetical protein RL73_05880 [Liberibacter crescens]
MKAHFLTSVIKIFLSILTGITVFFIGFFVFVGTTSLGARLFKEGVSFLISTENRSVVIGEMEGLISGALRIDRIAFKDKNGIYGEVYDFKLDWSPLQLFTCVFKADNFSIREIRFYRMPTRENDSSRGKNYHDFKPFFDFNIDNIDIHEIFLNKSLVGNDVRISARGKLQFSKNIKKINFFVFRPDQPKSQLKVNIAHDSPRNFLSLNIELFEPKEGLVSRILALSPMVSLQLKLSGEGYLDDFKSQFNAVLDNKNIAFLKLLHSNDSQGKHFFTVSGKGNIEKLVPMNLHSIFSGWTSINILMASDMHSKIDIDYMKIATDKCKFDASGVYDSLGYNSLSARFLSFSEPVDFLWPSAVGDWKFKIKDARFSLVGDASSAKLDSHFSVPLLEHSRTKLEGVIFSAYGQNLDLTHNDGDLNIVIVSQKASFNYQTFNQQIATPTKITVPVNVSANRIILETVRLENDDIKGSLSGKYYFSNQNFVSRFQIFIQPSFFSTISKIRFKEIASLSGELSFIENNIHVSDVSFVVEKSLKTRGYLLYKEGNISSSLFADILDSSSLIEKAKGSAKIMLTVSGPFSHPDVLANFTSNEIIFADHRFSELKANLKTKIDVRFPDAFIKLVGRIDDDQLIDIVAQLIKVNDRVQLSVPRGKFGLNSLQGQAYFAFPFKAQGKFTFNFQNINLIMAFLGQNVHGNLQGSLNFDPEQGTTVKASGVGVVSNRFSIKNPKIDLKILDFNKFSIQGKANIEEISFDNQRLSKLHFSAIQEKKRTDIHFTGYYLDSPLNIMGWIVPQDGKKIVGIDHFSIDLKDFPINLSTPVRFNLDEDKSYFDNFSLQIGKDSSISAVGKLGRELDLQIQGKKLPAHLVKMFVPTLAVAGKVSGLVIVKGQISDPLIRFKNVWEEASAQQISLYTSKPISVEMQGEFFRDVLTVNLYFSNKAGLSVRMNGDINFKLNLYKDFSIKGNFPLELFNKQLIERGFYSYGIVNLNLSVKGLMNAPGIFGSLTINKALLKGVINNYTLYDLKASVNFDGKNANVKKLTAKLGNGGSMTAEGVIDLRFERNYHANLVINLNQAIYLDENILKATFDSSLRLVGPLIKSPVLSGHVKFKEFVITIPDKMPFMFSEFDISHKNASKEVRGQTLALKNTQSNNKHNKSFKLGLDLILEAPSQIFVRGRGLNVELNGDLNIRNTTTKPIVLGLLTLRRGQITILNRRLNIVFANVRFNGELMPYLNIQAKSNVSSTSIRVDVVGLASSPSISFSSSPALPQDEILAQLIFGKSLANLSVSQLVQLANAVNQLVGGPSILAFDELRSRLGIDNFEVYTNSEGQSTIAAGKYINNNTYIELRKNIEGASKAIVNFDIGSGLKLNAGASDDGEGSVGVTYEKKY